jgi:hypothetical protein
MQACADACRKVAQIALNMPVPIQKFLRFGVLVSANRGRRLVDAAFYAGLQVHHTKPGGC